MKKVLVTGAQGQLGRCIKKAAPEFPELDFFYADKSVLDITSKTSLTQIFSSHSFDYCINAAAYTNVEKAESDEENAYLINADGAKEIAYMCKEYDVILLHISTDYVFDGKSKIPYVETDATHPINVYGASKLKGEKYIQELWEKHFILRTSWLYSEFGHNFLNSMLRFAAEKRDLKITTEQIGTPTNANDLAQTLLYIISKNATLYGIYHFSNDGEATWYDFAEEIFEVTGEIDQVNLAKTKHYTTFAARPKYSVLSKDKLNKHFGIATTEWKKSLAELIITKKS